MVVLADREKVSLAINTRDIDTLFSLMQDVSSRVRRAVARNKFAPKEIVNILVNDPVLNVSYMASQNKNCTKTKVFPNDTDHPCVCCKAKEDIIDCEHCSKIKSFNNQY